MTITGIWIWKFSKLFLDTKYTKNKNIIIFYANQKNYIWFCVWNWFIQKYINNIGGTLPLNISGHLPVECFEKLTSALWRCYLVACLLQIFGKSPPNTLSQERADRTKLTELRWKRVPPHSLPLLSEICEPLT